MDRLAADSANAVRDAAQKRCLVLMPFGSGHDGFYTGTLRPAIEQAGYIPHRIDRDEWSGNIESLFVAAVQRASAIVIDVTGANPNVMCELGHIHGQGADPVLLLLRRPVTRRAYGELPFYPEHQRLERNADTEAGRKALGRAVVKFLRHVAR